MAMRMSGSCSRARASASPPDSRCATPRRSCWPAGITTAFLGVTLSWEPGLRSLEAWRRLMAALERGAAAAGRSTCGCICGFEADNLDALDDALADIAAGRVHLLGFNDHTPSILKKLGNAKEVAKYAGRAGMSAGGFPRAGRSASRRGAARCRRPARRLAAAARRRPASRC